MSLCQSFLFTIFTSTHSASNSHFLFSFSLVLLLFYFAGGVADTLACPVFSPSPRHPGSCGSSSTFPRPHWVPTPSPAALCSSHTWRNGCGALPVAGGAATTGKDATVTLTLRTPVQFWRNSVSSVISLSLCPFAVTPLRYPASCSVSASRCPIFACVFLINQLMFLQLKCSPARAL